MSADHGRHRHSERLDYGRAFAIGIAVNRAPTGALLRSPRALLRDRFGIAHCTIHLEREDAERASPSGNPCP